MDAFYSGREVPYAASEKCVADDDCTAWVLTGSVPFNFSTLDFTKNGVSIGAKVQLGAAVALIGGKGHRNSNGSLTLTPIFSVGASILGGVSAPSGTVGGSFGLAAFVGLGPIAIMGGYDFVQSAGFLGLSARVDSFVVSDFLTMFLSLKKSVT